MKHMVVMALSALVVAAPGSGQTVDPAGQWTGAIEGPRRPIPIFVSLERGEDGAWAGSIDIPVAALSGARLNVTVEGGRIRFDLAGIPGAPSFDGSLSESGAAITGSVREGMEVFPFKLRRPGDEESEPSDAAAPPRRPQDPEPPFPYEAVEIEFSGGGGIKLAGTLVVPEGVGPFPAVALVSGSGPQDRDETVASHRPFLVIADHLARHGIASLRWDDRGVGASGGELASSTHADLAGDVSAAVARLASEPRVAPDAVGVIGHSEGGLIGPRVAVADPGIRFLVLLAGPGEPLDRLMIRQSRAALRGRGVADAMIDQAAIVMREELDLVKDPSLDAGALADTLRSLARSRRAAWPDAERALGVDSTTIELGIRQSVTPWFRSLMREDPAVHLAATRVPILALFGEKDVQVPPDPNAGLVERVLRDAAHSDYEVRVLPGLNHLFQTAGTGAIDEYFTIEETFAPIALDAITRWIAVRFARARSDLGR